MAPQLLAFPHAALIGRHHVYSEAPIDPTLAPIVAAADRKVLRSPIGDARAPDQPIFLTQGGWRWTWLAATQRGAFALSRPFSEQVVVNASNTAADRVTNGRSIGGERSLSSTIAHEMAHGLVRAHFGNLAVRSFPNELVEGYCDYVAGESSLSDRVAASLIAQGIDHPALPYWHGRKRVEADLQRNGGSVDLLFAKWGA